MISQTDREDSQLIYQRILRGGRNCNCMVSSKLLAYLQPKH